MTRPLRLEFPGALRREDIFLDDTDRQTFLELLAKEIRQQRWRLYAYCLMSRVKHECGENATPSVIPGHGLAEENRHQHAFWLPEDADGHRRSPAGSYSCGSVRHGTQGYRIVAPVVEPRWSGKGAGEVADFASVKGYGALLCGATGRPDSARSG